MPFKEILVGHVQITNLLLKHLRRDIPDPVILMAKLGYFRELFAGIQRLPRRRIDYVPLFKAQIPDKTAYPGNSDTLFLLLWCCL